MSCCKNGAKSSGGCFANQAQVSTKVPLEKQVQVAAQVALSVPLTVPLALALPLAVLKKKTPEVAVAFQTTQTLSADDNAARGATVRS